MSQWNHERKRRVHPARDHGRRADHRPADGGVGAAPLERGRPRSTGDRRHGGEPALAITRALQARQRELPHHRPGSRRARARSHDRAASHALPGRWLREPEDPRRSMAEAVEVRDAGPEQPTDLRPLFVRRRRPARWRRRQRRHRELGSVGRLAHLGDTPMKHRLRDDGFTLLEIMVVVLIIGMLMALLAPRLFGQLTRAKGDIARMQVTQLSQSLELYKLDNGTYPTTDQGLDALAHEPSSEPRPKRYPAGGYVNPK